MSELDIKSGKPANQISRRQFLVRMATLGLSAGMAPALLAACGASKKPAASTATPGAAANSTTSGGTSGSTPGSTTTGITSPAGTSSPVAQATTGASPSTSAMSSGTSAPSAITSQLAPMAVPTKYSGTPTGGEFDTGWPYQMPPTGTFNSFNSNAISLGIWLQLMEMPLAMREWQTGKYIPYLATSWQLNPPDEFVVYVRKGVQWSNGKPFTSRDVLTTFTITRMLAYPVWDYLGSMNAPDDYTVVFKMKKPSTVVPHFVLESNIRSDVVYGKFAKEAKALFDKGLAADSKQVSAVATKLQKFQPDEMVVTGPYQIDKSTLTSAQVTLKKVQTAWNADQCNFDTILVYNTFANVSGLDAMVVSKKMDYYTGAFPVSVVNQLKKEGVRVLGSPTYSGPALYFNLQKVKEFSDPKVRQALAYAINRSLNATVSLGAAAKPSKYMTGVADELISDWVSQSDLNQMNFYSYDQKKAADLLTSAGWKKSGNTWQTPEGKPAKYEVFVPSDYPDWQAGASNLSDQLNAFGFDTKVRGTEATQYFGRYNSGDFQLGINTWSTSSPHPYFSYQAGLLASNTLAEGGGMHFPLKQSVPGMGTIDFGKLINQSAEGLDISKQKQVILKLAKAYNAVLPGIPLWERYGTLPVVSGLRVTGWPPDSDPLWQNPIYADPAPTIWIMNGTLKGVKK